jgi:hypothetical protein
MEHSKEKSEERRPRSLRRAAPLLLSGLALFAATTGIATALPGQDSVNSGDIKDNTVKSRDLKDGAAVGSVDVIDNSLTAGDLAPNSVRSQELGDGIHAHSATANVPGGVNQNGAYVVRSATASCGANEELISGSAHWSNEGANEELFVSEVVLNHSAETVTVKGGNDTANDRTLVAVAHCL